MLIGRVVVYQFPHFAQMRELVRVVFIIGGISYDIAYLQSQLESLCQ